MIRAPTWAALVVLGGCTSLSVDDDRFEPGSAGGKADVFGEDERGQLLDAAAPVRSWGRSVAVLTQAGAFQCDAETCVTDLERLGPVWKSTFGEAFELCEGERFFDEPTVAPVSACTAFVVAQDLVLTAAHCVTVAPATFCNNRIFVFDFALGASADPRVVDADDVYGCTEIVEFAFAGDGSADATDAMAFRDYALVRLDRPVDTAVRPPLPLSMVAPLPDAEVVVIGHPFGLPAKVSIGRVLDVPADAAFFVHDADTLYGSSGSPVIALDTGAVVGVHVRGSELDPFRANVASSCNEIARCPSITEEPSCGGNVAMLSTVFF